MRRWRLWPILAGLLILNYWVASTIPDKPARAHIAYSPQFLREVQRNNVRLVTISEQNIEGEFKQAVTFDKKHFTRFETNQPALPTDTTLLGQLKARGVEINAKAPDSGRGVLAQILLGFGPTLLILGIIIFAMRRATAGGGALGSLGRSRAKRYEGTRARHVRGRRGHRGGRAGARRGRRLPQEPRQVRRARRQDPARRAALGPARHRQDAARARGRGRGRRAVLLGQRERVRRDDRRRRRLARARPLRAGQGGTARDRLHRRARCDRPRARRRREPRRPRRARADAQPDPHRDGRLQPQQRRDRARRHQPARRARQGAAAARAASTAASSCRRRTGRAGSRSCRCTRARCRSTPMSTSARSPRRRPAWSAPTSRTSSTRPRCWPRGGATGPSRWPTSPMRSRRSCWASSGA